MTRWAMVADLRLCVGCQTCTAACKHANATNPAVQWRKVLDIEVGEFPDVGRVFVPVGCMHCADPPCMHVCPSTATGQRDDGIVTIDYELCIGCAYCAVACPYQARYKVDKPKPAYGKDGRMRHEIQREMPERFGVAQKCTFCADKVDYGLANGLTPGIDAAATPACVNSCIADALHFGDRDNPDSNISKLLTDHRHFRMHEELGTDSGFYYLWEKALNGGDNNSKADMPPEIAAASRGVGGVGAAAPWLQQHWDWRAAGNFIGGGTGTGLLAAGAMAAFFGAPVAPLSLIALVFIAAGLSMVWAELGRPWRALNVIFNPQTSWMTRESLVAGPVFALALAAAWFDSANLMAASALFGLCYLYCQARMLHGGKGIPAWRDPKSIPLMISAGLAEGAAVLVLITIFRYPPVVYVALNAMLLLVILRLWAWRRYQRSLNEHAPDATNRVISTFGRTMAQAGGVVPFALGIGGILLPEYAAPLYLIAALSTVLSGWALKHMIVTKASYNQGFAIAHRPERAFGAGGGSGAAPGWGDAV